MKKCDESYLRHVKEEIKDYALGIGVDDIGFASINNYNSPNTPPIKEIYPEAKTIIVLAFQQLDIGESENINIASSGYRLTSEYADTSTYKIARYLKQKYRAKVIPVSSGTPVNRDPVTNLLAADFSLRHAAVAAGLGNFGRHNIVLHPRMGSKVRFTAILTNLEIEPDTPMKERLCIDCDICVKECPVHALDEKNRTDVMKCLLNSQPYGLMGYIQFWMKFAESTQDERKGMITDIEFKKLYDTLSLKNQYICFNCTKNCPIGE